MKSEYFDQIYDYMLGFTRPETIDPKIVHTVSNEFEEDAYCSNLYDRIYQARIRLGRRLRTDEEDRDIMIIVRSYESMARHLAKTAYQYGLNGVKGDTDSEHTP